MSIGEDEKSVVVVDKNGNELTETRNNKRKGGEAEDEEEEDGSETKDMNPLSVDDETHIGDTHISDHVFFFLIVFILFSIYFYTRKWIKKT